MSAVKTARLATAEGTPDTYSSLPQEPRLTCISHHMCPQHICAPQPSDKPHTCMPCTDTTSNTHISLLTYTHTYIMHALHLQITLTHTRLTQYTHTFHITQGYSQHTTHTSQTSHRRPPHMHVICTRTLIAYLILHKRRHVGDHILLTHCTRHPAHIPHP